MMDGCDDIGRMKEYLQAKKSDFKITELLEIMDSFKDALHSHLKSEPLAIVALASTAPRRILLAYWASLRLLVSIRL